MNKYTYDWSDLVFNNKKHIKELDAIFFAPSIKISVARFIELVKEYLPKNNIVIGISKEKYIDGFDGQPQFQTLQIETIHQIIDKVNLSNSPHKIYVLLCNQKDTVSIINKVKFNNVLFINGSWLHSFHMRPEYYTLVSNNIKFKLVSPFIDENEAKNYAKIHQSNITLGKKSLTDIESMKFANEIAKKSFANEHQTGAIISKKIRNKYKPIIGAYNVVVPYETFAWHNGASRERHLSPMGDLTHYDTVHAEVSAIIDAQKNKIDLCGTTLFINLLPCPSCARMLCETDISEIIYSLDHSDGYAVSLLEKAGKTVSRLIVENDILSTKEG